MVFLKLEGVNKLKIVTNFDQHYVKLLDQKSEKKKKNIKGAEVLANMYMTWIEFQNRKKKTGCADTPSYHSTVGEKRSM